MNEKCRSKWCLAYQGREYDENDNEVYLNDKTLGKNCTVDGEVLLTDCCYQRPFLF